MHIIMYTHLYIYHRHGNQVSKEMKGFTAFIIFGVPVWILVDVQTNVGSSGTHAQWFSCWKIRANDHDVIS